MAMRAINITVSIDGESYAIDAVGDPDDVKFAVAAGRAVTNCLVSFEREQREKAGE